MAAGAPANDARTGRKVLGVFAKCPQPGHVKTRLASATSPAWAAEVADAFLLDFTDKLAALDAERVLAFSPIETEAYFRKRFQARFTLVPQVEGHLGERMAAFFAEQFQTGAERVVLLGADSPTLPVAYVEQAFRELERADVVFGPAMDGGYYLVGCARRAPPIFADSEWSHHRVLAAAVARLCDPAWRVALLPPWYDVDTLQDWLTLQGHVTAMRRAGIDPGLPRTQTLLERFSI